MACLSLRVVALVVATTLGGGGALLTVRAEPGIAARPLDACKRAAFRLVIDVGHTADAPGARSARGISEFVFNLALAKRIEDHLDAAGFRRTVLLITDGPARKGLAERVRRANALGADLLLSIHHDSVPDRFLEKWEFEGEERSFSDRFRGHSIFVSHDNSDRAGSLLFARLLGNRQRLLVDAQAGVYRYDQLIVLRNTGMPAVLLEAGSIINRDEELLAGSVERQTLISAAVTDAVEAFCAARRPRAPTTAASGPSDVSRQTAAPAAAVAPSRMVKQR
jgi:N-acetylmuramoyl-L-alanine amidase